MKKFFWLSISGTIVGAIAIVILLSGSFSNANAQSGADPDVLRACSDLPGHDALTDALTQARNENDGGFDLDMWGTLVNRDGIVCVVAFTGNVRGDQWPGSRVISAQKANTANAFSLTGLALSTANLYAATQPGGSLFGLQHSNPVDTDAAYSGQSGKYGKRDDPMVGEKIGGVNVFGGGTALYDSDGILVGALGVSGDSSCADHSIAWRTRSILELDYVPAGVSGDPARPDNIIFDMADDIGGNPESASGFGHPNCVDAANEMNIADNLPPIRIVQVALSDFTNLPDVSWAITAVASSTSEGIVQFNVTNINNGPPDIPHDMVVVETNLAPDALPRRTDPTCDGTNTCGVDETQVTIVGRTALLFPGDSETLSLDLSAGNYVLFCSVSPDGNPFPSHYADGMFSSFTVNSN